MSMQWRMAYADGVQHAYDVCDRILETDTHGCYKMYQELREMRSTNYLDKHKYVILDQHGGDKYGFLRGLNTAAQDMIDRYTGVHKRGLDEDAELAITREIVVERRNLAAMASASLIPERYGGYDERHLDHATRDLVEYYMYSVAHSLYSDGCAPDDARIKELYHVYCDIAEQCAYEDDDPEGQDPDDAARDAAQQAADGLLVAYHEYYESIDGQVDMAVKKNLATRPYRLDDWRKYYYTPRGGWPQSDSNA